MKTAHVIKAFPTRRFFPRIPMHLIKTTEYKRGRPRKVRPEDLTKDEKLILLLFPPKKKVITIEDMAKKSGITKRKVKKIFQKFMKLKLIEKRGVKTDHFVLKKSN